MTLQIAIIIILVLTLIFVISAYDITTKTLKQKNKQLFDSLMSTPSSFKADLKKLRDDYSIAAADAAKFEGLYHSANKRAVWAEQGIADLAQVTAEIQAGKRYKKSDPRYLKTVEKARISYINKVYSVQEPEK